MFWLDDGLGSEIYLDGIITLVDAKHIREVSCIYRITQCSLFADRVS